MRSAWLLMLPLIGCQVAPEPVQPDCPRTLVDIKGRLRTDASPPPAPPPPVLVVEGEVQVVSAFAPLTICATDEVRVNVEVVDADLLVADSMLERSSVNAATHVVSATARFTPHRGGRHTVRFSFEPALGVRTVQFEVAALGLRQPAARVPVRCEPEVAWAVAADAVACEVSNVVEVSSSDGGTERFAGKRLVVAGDTLWSSVPLGTVLERRVFEDGGLRLTHTLALLEGRTVAGLHSENTAVRDWESTGLAVVQPGALGQFSVAGSARAAVTGMVWWAEPKGTLWWNEQGLCPAPCTRLASLVAIDRGVAWSSVFGVPNRLQGFAAPISQKQKPEPTLVLDQPFETGALPWSGFERIPLWLSTDFGRGLRVLVTADRGFLEYSAWPRAEVLRVGRFQVLLTDPEAGVVRVVNRE